LQKVRRVQSAALLVRRGGDVPDGGAVGKSGLAAEIRPLMDPTVLPLGATLPVRVYVEGASLSGATLEALAPDGTKRAISADREGIAHVLLDRAGRWRLVFHHLRESKGESTLFTGTLTFEVSK